MEAFKERKERLDKERLLTDLMSKRWMFAGRNGPSINTIGGGYTLQGEPKLVDEVVLNREKWELWEGTFADTRGIGSIFTWVLRLLRVPKEGEEYSILAYRSYTLDM